MTLSPASDGSVTDPVTQANVRAPDDSPAYALGSIYAATAYALNEAVQNAVNTQQQTHMLAQAATSQAVIQLLSINSASNTSSLDSDKASAIPQVLSTTPVLDSSANTIEEAIESLDKLDKAAPWCLAVREIMHTAAAALGVLQIAPREANMAMVRQAAIAAALVGMIRAPDQLEQYQKILELAQKL